MPSRSTSMTVRTEGLRELARDLRRAEDDTRPLSRKLRHSNKRIADVVRDTARHKASRFRKTGKFEKSITSRASTRSAYVKGGSDVRVPYFGPINFGWPARNIEAQEVLYSSLAEETSHISDLWLDYVKEIEDIVVGRRFF